MNYDVFYEILDYNKLHDRLDKIVHNPNNKFKVEECDDLGESSCGFPLKHYKIGKGKKHIIYFAGCHGNEIIGVDFITTLMHNLALGKGLFKNFKEDEYTIDFIPILNPEGFYTTTYALKSILNSSCKDLEKYCHDYFLAYKEDDLNVKNINDLLKDICKELNYLDKSEKIINKFWHYFKNYDYLTKNNILNYFKLYNVDHDKLRMILDDLIIKYFPSMNIPILKKHQMMLNNVSLNVIPSIDKNHQKLIDKLANIYKENLFPLSTLANFYANGNGVNLNDNNPYYYDIFKNRLEEEKDIYAKGRENNILISVKSPIGMPNYDMTKPFVYEKENVALFNFLTNLKNNNEYYLLFNCHGTGGLLYARCINNEEFSQKNIELANIYLDKIKEVYQKSNEDTIYNIMPKGNVITGVGDVLREEYPYAFLLELSKMGGNPIGPYGDKKNHYLTMVSNMEALMSILK